MHAEKQSAEGLWDASIGMEASARSALRAELGEYEEPLRWCYEAGVQSAAVGAGKPIPEHLAVAGLFLKKVLTDLRTSWLLLSTGYTSPAATIIACLWENALTVATVANHPESLLEIESENGDIPWGPQELAKRSAKDSAADSLKAGLYDQYEKVWREVYAQYKWICKVKHPTMRSATHDALSASVRSDEYVIMAAPDVRPEDSAAKILLLSVAVTRTMEAIASFVAARQPDDSDPAYQECGRMLRRVQSKLPLFEKGLHGELPFHIANERIAEEYRDIQARRSATKSSDADA